ncbi:MAG TPA: hypothetical protein VNO33_09100, partial [Kofleriaceae bacterium]|nr:hypothetical protein [Kofleriaceae bacterium]
VADQPVSMQPGGVSARVDLASVAASGCMATWGRVWLCAGGEFGRMMAEASSRVDADSGAGLWISAHAGPSAAWPIGRSVELVVDAEAVLPLAYPRFTLNGEHALGEPAPVGVRSGVGLRLLFP